MKLINLHLQFYYIISIEIYSKGTNKYLILLICPVIDVMIFSNDNIYKSRVISYLPFVHLIIKILWLLSDKSKFKSKMCIILLKKAIESLQKYNIQLSPKYLICCYIWYGVSVKLVANEWFVSNPNKDSPTWPANFLAWSLI